MGTYNQFAGRSVERLAALSDGVFAVAMTLLVLDLKVPAADAVQGEHDLWQALVVLAPRLLIYFMSFMTLGIFWIGQQTQLNHLARSDRDLSWIHLAFLCAITLTPFSTSLMAEFIVFRVALVAYWLNVLVLGIIMYAAWRCSVRHGLLRPELTAALVAAMERRIVLAQMLYGFGALLCVFSPYWSIGFIIACQLNYVIAPRILGLDRL
ncbi:MAG: TMEM175 family protein [Acetobacteraceae bacterium]|nr:TMEM175 family protein [Acetobacteraceae bacterium]